MEKSYNYVMFSSKTGSTMLFRVKEVISICKKIQVVVLEGMVGSLIVNRNPKRNKGYVGRVQIPYKYFF